MPVNLDSFTGPGSTPSRRRFWDKVTQAVNASQKVEGRNVSVDEYQGMGTVINVIRERGGTTTGACCIDHVCSITTEAACTEGGGTYLGNGTPCTPDPCACGFTVEFSGVTFGCACLALGTEAHYEFYEGGMGGDPINGVPFPVDTIVIGDCPSCKNDPAGTLNFRFYFAEGCADDFEEGGSDYAVYVALISGVYYIMVADLGNSIIFFYGTTTNLAVPAANEVTLTSSPTTWDNALLTCIGTGSVELCGVGTGGTAILS